MPETPGTLVACARMYCVSPPAAAAWRALLEWIADRSGVALEVIDYPPPAPLEALWSRPDVGAAFMCGWPFATRVPPPTPIAAPCPSPARYGGRPVYFSDFVVRAGSDARTLEDTFGGRIAWTAERSHSGFNAPRYHLLRYRRAGRERLYTHSIGPLLTPRAALESVVAGEVDVAAVDSYALDLLCHHEPRFRSLLRVVDSTAAAPVPLLVASPNVGEAACRRLSAAFHEAGSSAPLRDLLGQLLLSGFAAVRAGDYAVLEARARSALAAGYRAPG